MCGSMVDILSPITENRRGKKKKERKKKPQDQNRMARPTGRPKIRLNIQNICNLWKYA